LRLRLVAERRDAEVEARDQVRGELVEG
jgi:hypothetical protein